MVFPFEEELYRKEGVDVEFVGHPIADTAICELTRDEAKAEFGLQAYRKCCEYPSGKQS